MPLPSGVPNGSPALVIARDIKLSHSVFALPFALLGAFMARPENAPWDGFGAALVLIVVCMVTARTWAMVVNRLLDRGYDARNPRTAARAFASGRLHPRTGWAWALASAAAFVGACALFMLRDNPWPLILAGPVLAWIGAYSLTKRFTWACHLWLGASLAASPLAAAIAVDPAAVGLAMGTTTPALFWLAAMVLAWVAGFDVIYALADEEFDRAAGLSSLPSRMGPSGALWVSRGLHALAALALLAAWRSDDRLGAILLAAVAAVWGLLVLEHAVIARRGRAGIPSAFFTVNGVVSCLLGLAGITDLLV